MSLLLNKAMFKERIDSSFYYGLGFFGGLFGAEVKGPDPTLSGDIPYDDIGDVFESVIGAAKGDLNSKMRSEIKEKLLPLGVELLDEGVDFLYDSYLKCLE